jgi:hypothetical protein
VLETLLESFAGRLELSPGLDVSFVETAARRWSHAASGKELRSRAFRDGRFIVAV